MFKKRQKIRERRDSRFTPGIVSAILFLAVVVLAQIARRPPWTAWLAREIGLGELNHYAFMALFIGFVSALGCVTVWLATRHKKRLQPLRNQELLAPGPKALFLRPFYADKGLALPNPFYSYWSSGLSMDAGNLLPEEFVGRVLEPFVNVVQVGGSPATVGNATLSVPDDVWELAVAEAADSASAIIILPVLGQDKKTGHTLGNATILELKYLVDSGRISRTIAIMPNVPWNIRKSTRQGWEKARLKALAFGLILPEYDKKGGAMTFEFTDGWWRIARTFGQAVFARKRVALGLIEAVSWLAEREQFDLLDR